MKGNFTKIVFYNTFFLALFLILLELVLGEWKNIAKSINANYLVPSLIKNRVIKYDARNLYNSSKSVPITYSRDVNGYRSKDENSSKRIVLTIGGSTTDQRYITDGETWQDYLDKMFPAFDFINGGVDGQSTYGHLSSINSWHSFALNKNLVDTLIFYLGVNDPRLLSNITNSSDEPQSISMAIKTYLNQYSFFYPRLKKVYLSIFRKSNQTNGILAMHVISNENFVSTLNGIPFSASYTNNYHSYKKLFLELISQTKKHFPKSNIVIIQQQAPGCKFNSKYAGIDIHPYKNPEENNDTCSKLAAVYSTQDEALRSLPSLERIDVLPMYLEDILDRKDVYDFIHTNPAGSKKIGAYIQRSGVLSN